MIFGRWTPATRVESSDSASHSQRGSGRRRWPVVLFRSSTLPSEEKIRTALFYAPPLTLQSLDVPRTPSIYRYTNSDGYVIPHSALFSSTSSSPIGGHQDAPQPVPHQTSQRQSNFSDGSGPLFNMYVKMAEEEDDKMADLWQKDAKTILIFVSSPINFFTAIVVQQLT